MYVDFNEFVQHLEDAAFWIANLYVRGPKEGFHLQVCEQEGSDEITSQWTSPPVNSIPESELEKIKAKIRTIMAAPGMAEKVAVFGNL